MEEYGWDKVYLNGSSVNSPQLSRLNSSIIRSSTPVEADGLSWPSKGTRVRATETEEQREVRLKRLSEAVKTMIECVGEDPEREGVLKTPMRYAKAMLFFTKGYEQNVTELINEAVFNEDHEEMVIVKNIDVFSLCEHHLVPFTGKVYRGTCKHLISLDKHRVHP
ncbi:hypothetical protein DSO57_1004997 [Entomophthora muscae]|uniref:Uncharacterized protein n=1 Tax=Entomophthora muscae TaxID=34485 RepID=A0ACC2SX85_9FUNG|nr:hypothetical protein DSO57_1004997 [Entomophthora muscae]